MIEKVQCEIVQAPRRLFPSYGDGSSILLLLLKIVSLIYFMVSEINILTKFR